jgi:ketosteroid isomerase-like protein
MAPNGRSGSLACYTARMRHAAIFVAALALAGCPKGERETMPARPASPPDVLSAARGTIEQWRQAYQIKGLDVLSGLYAHEPELVLVHDGRAHVGWASVEALLKDRLARYLKIVIRLKDINVVPLGATGATATASITRELGDDVTTIMETGALTMVLRRDGERWVIVTEHYSYRRGNG